MARALIVEDEEQVRVLAESYLREQGHHTLSAARRQRPDLKVLYTTGQGVTDGMKAMMVEGSAILEKSYTVEQLQHALGVHFGIMPNSK